MIDVSRRIEHQVYLSVSLSEVASYPGMSSPMAITPSSAPEVLCCHVIGCEVEFHGKYRKGNLNRHLRLYHQATGVRIYHCADPFCPKEFRRQDARLKHYRRRHPHLGVEEAVLRGPQHQEQQGRTLRDVSTWTGSMYDSDEAS
jgi:hypothetical protein